MSVFSWAFLLGILLCFSSCGQTVTGFMSSAESQYSQSRDAESANSEKDGKKVKTGAGDKTPPKNEKEVEFSFPEDSTGAYLTCIVATDGESQCGYPTENYRTIDGKKGESYAKPHEAIQKVKLVATSIYTDGIDKDKIDKEVSYSAKPEKLQIEDFRSGEQKNVVLAWFHVTFKSDSKEKTYEYIVAYESEEKDGDDDSEISYLNCLRSKRDKDLICTGPGKDDFTIDGKSGWQRKTFPRSYITQAKVIGWSDNEDGDDVQEIDKNIDVDSYSFGKFRIDNFDYYLPKKAKWASYEITFKKSFFSSTKYTFRYDTCLNKK